MNVKLKLYIFVVNQCDCCIKVVNLLVFLTNLYAKPKITEINENLPQPSQNFDVLMELQNRELVKDINARA